MNLQQLIAMRDTIHFESLTANEMTDNQIKRRKFIMDNIAVKGAAGNGVIYARF